MESGEFKFFQRLTSYSLSFDEDCRLVVTLKECTLFATFALPVTLSLFKNAPSPTKTKLSKDCLFILLGQL